MKRSAVILFIDIVSFIGFVFLTSTGVLLHYVLPAGSGRWSDIWGLNRHEWGDIHYFIAVLFFSVLALHLLLHWRVILNMIKGHTSNTSWLRAGLGITGLIAILLFAFAPVAGTINTDDSVNSKGSRYQYNLNK